MAKARAVSDVLRNHEKPPRPNYLSYLQADFVELRCLIQQEKTLDKYEAHSLYVADSDFDRDNEYTRLNSDVAENYDKQFQKLEEWYAHLRHRETAFCEAYPFSVDANSNFIQAKDNFNERQKLYIFLLMASFLNCFDKSIENHLTRGFETLCAEVLREYIGGQAVVKIFGTSSADYRGNKYKKIAKLAADLNEIPLVNADSFSRYDSKDAGLDIVGWLPTQDESPGRLAVFGQCACGNDWEAKQHSSGFDKWSRLLTLTTRPVNTLFIPYCFRNTAGNWYAIEKIHSSLMFDRYRIMQLLSSVEDPLQCLSNDSRDSLGQFLTYINDT